MAAYMFYCFYKNKIQLFYSSSSALVERLIRGSIACSALRQTKDNCTHLPLAPATSCHEHLGTAAPAPQATA